MKKRSAIVLGLCAGVFVLAAMVAPALAASGSVLGNGAWPSMIKYYAINDGLGHFIRSAEPFATGVATQKHVANTVTVSTGATPGYVDSGIVVYDGKLADFPGFTLKGTGDAYGVNLWFDTNGDGEFFTWDGNTMLYPTPPVDTYGLGPTSASGVLTVTGDSHFYMMAAPYSSPTLDQLKAGYFSGINGDTHVTLWIGVNGVNKSATILRPRS